jgi:hypothetical protein
MSVTNATEHQFYINHDETWKLSKTSADPSDTSVFFLKTSNCIFNHHFWINIVLNAKKFLYKITVLLTTYSLMPLKVNSGQARKSTCRYLNKLNQYIRYGAYFIDMETGSIGFRILQNKTDYEYQKLINDSDFLD